MTSAFEKYHLKRGAIPHCLCGSFRGPNTLQNTIFPTLVAFRGKRNLQTPQCSLASSVLLPKIGFDPLSLAPFI